MQNFYFFADNLKLRSNLPTICLSNIKSNHDAATKMFFVYNRNAASDRKNEAKLDE